MPEVDAVIPPIDLPGAGNPGRHYLFLDGVRGFASLYVAIFHLLPWPAPVPHVVNLTLWVFKLAHSAVTAFIVLSGFSLMLPVAQSSDGRLRGGFGGYLARRSLRILPPYYAALLLSIGVSYACHQMPSDHTPGVIAAHVLLIHNWFGASIGQFNITHWSVAVEWQIYFLFPLVLLPSWRRGGRGAPLVVAAIISVAVVASSPSSDSGLRWTCPWYVLVFSIGMIAATFDQPAQFRSIGRAVPWAAVVIGVIFVMLFRAQHPGPSYASYEFAKDTLSGAVMAGFVVRYRGFETLGVASPVREFFETKPLRALGAMSYSLYLTHGCVVWALQFWAHSHGLPDRAELVIRIVVGLPMSLALAYLFSRCFERPFLKRPSGRGGLEAVREPYERRCDL